MAKRKVYIRYKTRKRGGQTYWKGRKGIAKSINKMNPELTEREAKQLMEMTFEGIKTNLKKEKRYSEPGFGTFRLQHRKARPARQGRNPFTGEPIRIKAKPSSRVVKFRPSKELIMGLR